MFLRRASGKATGIVAVFVGGVPQGAEKAGWLTHEVALPIIEVIAQLDAQKPNWQTMHGVTVQSP
jgi:hypothetical protein